MLAKEQAKAAGEDKAERDKRIEEFMGHIDDLRSAMAAKDERIALLARNKQEELNRLSAAHNQIVEELKTQIEFYKRDSERLKSNYEAQKKTLETDVAELVRSVHLLAGGSARPESSN
jgi:archaellum component FlaC